MILVASPSPQNNRRKMFLGRRYVSEHKNSCFPHTKLNITLTPIFDISTPFKTFLVNMPKLSRIEYANTELLQPDNQLCVSLLSQCCRSRLDLFLKVLGRFAIMFTSRAAPLSVQKLSSHPPPSRDHFYPPMEHAATAAVCSVRNAGNTKGVLLGPQKGELTKREQRNAINVYCSQH